MYNFIQDVRFAWRTLRRSPGFTLVAITTLALGIGANSAMFGVLNGFLLRPFPFRDPDRLIMVWEKNPKLEGFIAQRVPTCLKNYFEWRDQAKSFEGLAAYRDANVTLTGVDKPEQFAAEITSPNFFDMLGVRAAQGRTFSGDEGITGKDRLVLLTYSFYETHFGHDSKVVGRNIELDGRQYSIIGVLPRSFKLPGVLGGMDVKKPVLFLPLNPSPNQPADDLTDRKLYVFARLKPGVTLENARAEMDVVAKRLEQKDPELNQGFGTNVSTLRAEDEDADSRLGLLILQGFVGLVLLIACANIANLLLARGVRREKEMAVRSALGASRGRMIRQILAESMVLSVAGGLAGLILARWGLMVLRWLTPEDVLGTHELSVDFVVFCFTLAVVILAGFVFGMAPALYASRHTINQSLTRNSRSVTGSSGKLRFALVVTEIAMAVLLVASAGLMLRSLLALHNVNPGFDANHILTAVIGPLSSKYSKPEQIRSFCAELLEKAKAIPGVQSAALTSSLPMQSISETSFHLVGQESPRDNDYQAADVANVTEDYFSAMGTPILRGRGFTREETEQAEAGVIIVNESMAHKFWPNQDALDKVIIIGRTKPKRNLIIGVVADSYQLTLSVPVRPEMFRPARSFDVVGIVLRTAGDPQRLANALSAQVLSMDKDRPVSNVQTMAAVVTDTMSPQRFGTFLMMAFAVLALLLASIGLYGVLAYVVSQRTPEIGIRMALGARQADVLRMVLRQGFLLALTGVVLGIGAALVASHVMSSFLFGISAHDPLTFLGTAAVLAIVAMAATCVPAWRAARVDPMIALRYE
jgi:putative ABC transport system permease protein